MNKKDKNIKVENAVVGEFYKIEVDKTEIWEHQWVGKYDGLIVEYIGQIDNKSFYPYQFRLIMGIVESNYGHKEGNKKPGDILRFTTREAFTLKKL